MSGAGGWQAKHRADESAERAAHEGDAQDRELSRAGEVGDVGLDEDAGEDSEDHT